MALAFLVSTDGVSTPGWTRIVAFAIKIVADRIRTDRDAAGVMFNVNTAIDGGASDLGFSTVAFHLDAVRNTNIIDNERPAVLKVDRASDTGRATDADVREAVRLHVPPDLRATCSKLGAAADPNGPSDDRTRQGAGRSVRHADVVHRLIANSSRANTLLGANRTASEREHGQHHCRSHQQRSSNRHLIPPLADR